jgi:hypothetical protein
VGCRGGLDGARDLPALDRPYFDCRVQSVLTRDCATYLCHGDERRPFRTYARHRLRLGLPIELIVSPLTPEERTANYDNARAFVDLTSPADSLLLRKPLEASAGGAFHRGAEIFGMGNVFATRDDPDARVIADWIAGATEDPSCVEPGSDR